MTDTDSDGCTAVDQHSTDGVAFKEHSQCSDEFYALLREKALEHIDTGDHRPDGPNIQPEDIQLRKFVWEDGVISFEATHPHITHEDEIEADLVLDEAAEPHHGLGDGRELEKDLGGED
jgi:hypothetical protein